MGGSALFRACGTTHFGARKLISGMPGASIVDELVVPKRFITPPTGATSSASEVQENGVIRDDTMLSSEPKLPVWFW